MPAARYWRAVSVETHGGGDIELSALHVYGASSRVDAGATLSSTRAPTAGALANLQDADFGTTTRFSSVAVAAPSFALQWDFGVDVDVYGVRVAGLEKATFLKSMMLQYSSDGVTWASGTATLGDFIFPGAGVLTVQPVSPPWFYTEVGVWLARTGFTAYAVAGSTDGARLLSGEVSGYLKTSEDGGETWTSRTSAGSRAWYSFCVSADGQTMGAVGGSGTAPYRSINAGVTWTAGAGAGTRSWRGIASSADGVKMVAVPSGANIFTSVNSGANWTSRAISASWEAVTSSADGVKLAAVSSNAGIHTSVNSGLTWTKSPDTDDGRLWKCIAGSADGEKLLAGCDDGLYRSADSGATWIKVADPSQTFWCCVASSEDGVTLMAAVLDGPVYRSRDSGASWTQEAGAGSRTWHGRMALSSDGSKCAINANSFGICTVAFRDEIYATPLTRPVFTGSPGFFAASPLPDFEALKLQDTAFWRDMESAGRGHITDTVKEKNTPIDTPLRRRVRLFRDIDGLMVRETWSDGTSGVYSFLQIDERYTYSVIAYDHLGEHRAVIADGLTPELLPAGG